MNSIITFLLEKNFRWTAAVAAVAVLVVGYLAIISGQVNLLLNSGYLERSTVVRDLKAEKDYFERLSSATERYRQAITPETVQTVDNFIPSEADFPGLLVTIKNVAESSGLTLNTISIGQSGAAANTSTGKQAKVTIAGNLPLQAQDVSMTVSGGTSYEQFKNFLLNIEHSQRLLDVVSLNFSTAGGTGSTETSNNYTLTLRTYYLPETKT